MGNETTSLSVPKDHPNPKYDPDEDGVIKSPEVDIGEAFASEDGTIFYSSFHKTTDTVSLNRSYIPGTVNVDVGIQSYTGSNPDYAGAFLAGVSTDGNGNVNQIDIWNKEESSNDLTIYWRVTGIPA